MKIEEKKIYFFKGAYCPVCEQVLKDMNAMRKDETIEILPSEEHLFDIKELTQLTSLPIIVWSKNGKVSISSGLIGKKEIKKIFHEVK